MEKLFQYSIIFAKYHLHTCFSIHSVFFLYWWKKTNWWRLWPTSLRFIFLIVTQSETYSHFIGSNLTTIWLFLISTIKDLTPWPFYIRRQNTETLHIFSVCERAYIHLYHHYLIHLVNILHYHTFRLSSGIQIFFLNNCTMN